MRKHFFLVLLLCCVLNIKGYSKKEQQLATPSDTTLLQYWFNNNLPKDSILYFANTVNDQLNTDHLLAGVHILHTRFKVKNKWSSITSSTFLKNSFANGQSIIEYWFDKDITKNTINFTGNTPTASISTDNLSIGFHTLHTRFKLLGGMWSSITSSVFLKNSIANGQSVFEYWFDNNSQKFTQTFVGNAVIDSVPTNGLSVGYHNLHSRYKLNGGAWSSIVSSQFLKTSNSNGINKMEYWFDTAFAQKQSVTYTNFNIFNDSIKTNTIDTGWHIINTRFQFQSGAYTSVVADSFYKNSVDTFAITAIAETGGAVTPDSIVNLPIGSSKTFYFSANTGFCLDSVFVDGSYIGRVDSVAFTNILKPYLLRVTFKAIVTPSVSIQYTQIPTNTCVLQQASFTAIATNGGANPIFSWKKKGITVGINVSVLQLNNLQNADSVQCILTSNEYCRSNNTASSNVIKINIAPVVRNYPTIFGCNTVLYKNKIYNSSSLVRDTIKSIYGCDSVVNNVSITIQNIVAATQSQSVFGCNSLMFKGKTYTSSNIHRDTLKTTMGCDSIYKITNINIQNITPSIVTQNITGCDSAIFKNIKYTTSTTKRDTLKTSLGCDSVYNIYNIIVQPKPIIAITVDSNNFCAGYIATLTASGGSNYTWSPTYNLAPETGSIVLAKPDSTTTYTVTSNDICVVSKSITIYVRPTPLVNAGADKTILQGSSVKLQATGADNTYLWSNGATTDTTTVAPTSTKDYIVTGTNLIGCSNSDTVTVTVNFNSLDFATNNYNFGNVVTGFSKTYNLTITNNGTLPVSVIGINLTAPFSTTFIAYYLSAGNSVTMPITFAPTANLIYSNYATIHTSIGDFSINITGKGVTPAPSYTINTSNNWLGYVALGSAAQQFLNITNTGNVPISFSSIVSNNSTFSSNISTPSILPGYSTTATINFSPTTIGNASATITTNPTTAGLTSKSVVMNGFGYIPNTPPTLHFVTSQPYNGTKGVNPSVANPGLFTYRIKYISSTNTAPQSGFPKVAIDKNNNGDYSGTNEGIYTMTKVSNTNNWTTGEEYMLTTSLQIGSSYTYQFFANDALGNAALQANTGVNNGPVVTDQLRDLSIYANDINFSVTNPAPNQTFTVYATIHNNTPYIESNVNIKFYTDSVYYNETTLPFIAPYSTATVSMNFVYNVDGFYPIKVWIDKARTIVDEGNILNNYAIRPITVGLFSVPGNIAVSSSTIASNCPDGYLVIGSANYLPNNKVVAGALVSIKENGTSIGSGYTDVNGSFNIYIAKNCGSGNYSVEVTDFTLTGFLNNISYSIPCNIVCGTSGSGGGTGGAGGGGGGAGSSGGGFANESTASFRGAGNHSYIDGCQDIGKSLTMHNYFSNLGSISLDDTFKIYLEGVKVFEINYATINTGEVKYIPYNFIMPTKGRFIIEIKHSYYDYNGKRYEDKRDIPFYIEVAKPDYEIISLIQNGNSNVEVKIRNISCSTPAPSTKINIYKSLTNLIYVYQSTVNVINTTALSTGEIATFNWNISALSGGNHLFKFEIDPDNNVDEQKEFNNDQLINVFIQKPDLKVDNLQVSNTNVSQGDLINFSATITNVGNQVTPVNKAQFYINNALLGTKVNVSSLLPGASTTITSNSFAMPFNNCNLSTKLIVDVDNVVDEELENNNTTIIDFVSELQAYQTSTMQGSSASPYVSYIGSPLAMRFNVKNNGLRDANNVKVVFRLNGNIIGTDYIGHIGSYGNEYANLNYQFNTVGDFIINVSVDDDVKFCELNETDNLGNIYVSTVSALPDLRILSQHISPSNLNPTINQPITIATTIQNIGNLISSPTYIVVRVDGVQIGQHISFNAIKPGRDTTVLTTTTYSSSTNGSKIITAIVDPVNNQPEQDENNNEATRAIIVGSAPDFARSINEGITVNKTNLMVGDNITICNYLRNYGGAAATATLNYYITVGTNKSLIGTRSFSLNANDSGRVCLNYTITAFGTITTEIVNSNPQEFNILNNEDTYLLSPDNIIALLAIDHNTKAFTAIWNSIPGVTTYQLDVATDSNFTHLVAGYNGKIISDTTEGVIGLQNNTTYYYRVKLANNTSVSNVISTKTLEKVEPGITIIVHGFQAGGTYPNDFINLGEEIKTKAGGGVIIKNDPTTGKLLRLSDSFDNSKEIILLYDWAALSNNYQTNPSFSTGNGYMEAAADNLFATILDLGNYLGIERDVLLNKPKHLIGHSRGNIVLLQTLHRFAKYFPDIQFDQFTTLDPHPAAKFGDVMNTKNSNIINPPCIYGYASSCGNFISGLSGCNTSNNIHLKMPINVKRIDNYFRQDLSYEGVDAVSSVFSFDGVPIIGLNNYNRTLKNDLLEIGSPIVGGAHSGVHKWYLGTINTNLDVATYSIIPPLSSNINTLNWYSIDITSNFSNNFMKNEIRNTTGFFHSRIGEGSLVPLLSNSFKDDLGVMDYALKIRNVALNPAMSNIGIETVFGGYIANNNDAGFTMNGGKNTFIGSQLHSNHFVNMGISSYLNHSLMYFPKEHKFLKFKLFRSLIPLITDVCYIQFLNNKGSEIALQKINLSNISNNEVFVNIPISLIDEVGSFIISGLGVSVGEIELTKTGPAITNSITPIVNITSNSVSCNSNITFTANTQNACSNATINWFVNDKLVYTKGSDNFYYYYSSNSIELNKLNQGDRVFCYLTTSNCGVIQNAKSNEIIISAPTITKFMNLATGVFPDKVVLCSKLDKVTLLNYTTNGVFSPSTTNGINFNVVPSTYNRGQVEISGTDNVNTTLTYSVGTNLNCLSSVSIPIIMDTVVQTTPIIGLSNLCVGSATTLTCLPSGGVWSTNGRASISASTGFATGSSGGIATVSYKLSNANGCSKSSNRTLTVNVLPNTPSISYAPGYANPQSGCAGGIFGKNRTFGLTSNLTPGVWSATGLATVTQQGVVTTGNSNGAASITYTHTNTNGCNSFRTISGTVGNCASKGIILTQPFSYSIYPNPTQSILNIKVENLIGNGRVVLTDILGKKLKENTISLGINTISVKDLTKGTYLVSIITDKGKETQKIIVE